MVNRKTRDKQFNFKNLLLVALAFMFIFCLLPFNLSHTSADTQSAITYSNVLDDLRKDESFDVTRYPAKENDYSLKVIQIAESVNKELFVYVYQPSGKSKNIVATSINISVNNDSDFQSYNSDIDFQNYNLTLCNSSGTLFKYIIPNFIIPETEIRTYEISSILRHFDVSLNDQELTNGNIVDEVPFAVGKLYTFQTLISGGVVCVCTDIETISITSKYVGLVRYGHAENFSDAHLDDRHFVAFSTDKRIDKLLECEVCYRTQIKKTTYENLHEYPDEPYSYEFHLPSEKQYSYLTYDTKVDVTSDYGVWWGNKHFNYTWNAIQTPVDFLNSVNGNRIYQGAIFDYEFDTEMTEEGLNDIKGKDWIISFLTTDYFYDYNLFGWVYSTQTLVSEVTILRLKFEADGYTYNLGVIDNKQTGDGIPDNDTTVNSKLKIPAWLQWLLDHWYMILLIMVLAALIVAFFPQIIKGIWFVIKKVFQGLWWFITYPFKKE